MWLLSSFLNEEKCHCSTLIFQKDNNVCLLSTFSELQYLVADGTLAPEAKDIAVRENVDSKYIVIIAFFTTPWLLSFWNINVPQWYFSLFKKSDNNHIAVRFFTDNNILKKDKNAYTCARRHTLSKRKGDDGKDVIHAVWYREKKIREETVKTYTK